MSSRCCKHINNLHTNDSLMTDYTKCKLWNNIADFETNERKHESKNPLLSEARAGARMEAYVKLQEDLIWK